jgi:hypothetical protein
VAFYTCLLGFLVSIAMVTDIGLALLDVYAPGEFQYLT